MKCRDCAKARRFAEGALMCVHYGMIIREDHECEREGAKLRERDEDRGGEEQDEAGLQNFGAGAIEALP